MRITLSPTWLVVLSHFVILIGGGFGPQFAIANDKPATTQAAPDGVFEDESMPAKEGDAEETPGGPLKVGVMISHFTATGPHWGQSAYGYAHADIAKNLALPSITLFAIVEPDSENDPAFVEALEANFPAEVERVNAHDPAALKELDVIVANRIPNLTPEALEAIHSAVQKGTGLFIGQTFGTVTPGYASDPKLADLLGMDSPTYAFDRGESVVEVAAPADPLLEGVEGSDEAWVTIPNGAMGEPRQNVAAVLKVRSTDTINYKTDDAVGEMYLLYAHRFGKGGVVVQNFKRIPEPLSRLPEDDNLFIRCVRRAADSKQN